MIRYPVPWGVSFYETKNWITQRILNQTRKYCNPLVMAPAGSIMEKTGDRKSRTVPLGALSSTGTGTVRNTVQYFTELEWRKLNRNTVEQCTTGTVPELGSRKQYYGTVQFSKLYCITLNQSSNLYNNSGSKGGKNWRRHLNVRIRADPDPKHWIKVLQFSKL